MTQEQQNICMDLSEGSSVYSTSSGVPIFNQKDSKSGQYGGISHNESNNPSIQRHANHTAQD